MHRRDRLAVLGGLVGVALLAWIYLVVTAAGRRAMPGMSMDGMPGMATIAALKPWSAVDFALMFSMWAVMMIAMMLPSAAPMILLYVAVARKAAREQSPLPPTALFVAGYIVVWTLFSAAATAGQWALEQAALVSARMVATSPKLGAALLIAAGIWQLTPVKNACLEHCRAPALFLSEHWRDGRPGALRMGFDHGVYCLGCCWVLMGLLFLGGVMNLLWIAAIAVFVLLEKTLPYGVIGGRVSGIAMIVLGALLLTGFTLS